MPTQTPESVGWSVTRDILIEFADEVDQQGDRFLWTFVPVGMTREMRSRLATLGEELSVPVLDLGDLFERHAAAGSALQLEPDPHWSAEGHRLAADAIGEFVEQYGSGEGVREEP